MTDSDTYKCPVEGCDYGESEDKTLAQVRGHVNSSGDEDHVWQEAKHELLAEAEKREAQATDDDEDGGSDGETDDEEDDDQSDEDGEDSTEMATQKEYEEQHGDTDTDLPEDGGDGENGDEPTDTDGSDDQDGAGFTVPSVSASTVVVLAGLAVAGLLIWKLYASGDAASDYDDPVEDADTEDSQAGMLVDTDAGTGGVQT